MEVEYPEASTRAAMTYIPSEKWTPPEFRPWVGATCPRKKTVAGTNLLASVAFRTTVDDGFAAAA
jgi:hypothetical protein